MAHNTERRASLRYILLRQAREPILDVGLVHEKANNIQEDIDETNDKKMNRNAADNRLKLQLANLDRQAERRRLNIQRMTNLLHDELDSIRKRRRSVPANILRRVQAVSSPRSTVCVDGDDIQFSKKNNLRMEAKASIDVTNKDTYQSGLRKRGTQQKTDEIAAHAVPRTRPDTRNHQQLRSSKMKMESFDEENIQEDISDLVDSKLLISDRMSVGSGGNDVSELSTLSSTNVDRKQFLTHDNECVKTHTSITPTEPLPELSGQGISLSALNGEDSEGKDVYRPGGASAADTRAVKDQVTFQTASKPGSVAWRSFKEKNHGTSRLREAVGKMIEKQKRTQKLWDDVRTCRYLRGHEPPGTTIPENMSLTEFVFDRNNNKQTNYIAHDRSPEPSQRREAQLTSNLQSKTRKLLRMRKSFSRNSSSASLHSVK